MPVNNSARDATGLDDLINDFISRCTEPVLFEPGSETMPLFKGNWYVERRGEKVFLQAWFSGRVLHRRIVGIARSRSFELRLEVESFPKRRSLLVIIDQAHPYASQSQRVSAQLQGAHLLKILLKKQFPGFQIRSIAAGPDLQHSLSGNFPRAIVTRGKQCWAAILAPENYQPEVAPLTFGLIWLEHARARYRKLDLCGLLLFLPKGAHQLSCRLVMRLDLQRAAFRIFVYEPKKGICSEVDPSASSNLNSHLPPCINGCHLLSAQTLSVLQQLAQWPHVECLQRPDGTVSVRTNGLEWLRAASGGLFWGIRTKRAITTPDALFKLQRVARTIAQFRQPDPPDPNHPLYRANPELWLESRLRRELPRVHPILRSEPVYSQVFSSVGLNFGFVDLICLDQAGRLNLIEVKAEEDIFLPLQALAYWERCSWHLQQGEFVDRGYFCSDQLNQQLKPRLWLIAPSLQIHPANELILKYFSNQIPVCVVGLGLQWRREIFVAFLKSYGSHVDTVAASS